MVRGGRARGEQEWRIGDDHCDRSLPSSEGCNDGLPQLGVIALAVRLVTAPALVGTSVFEPEVGVRDQDHEDYRACCLSEVDVHAEGP